MADFCIYKAWISVHTKPLFSNTKLIAVWRSACILHDTGLKFCQATVNFIKRIVHMYILTCKIYPINTQLAINKSVQLMSECNFELIVLNSRRVL